MASTSPGLLQGPPFNPTPLAPFNEQAGVLPTPPFYPGLPTPAPTTMGFPALNWQNYQQALAQMYNAAALGTAPVQPPLQAGAIPPPFTTMGNVLPPIPGSGMLQATATPLPPPTDTPMYVAPTQGYVQPPDGLTTTTPTGPQPQEGATEGTVDGTAGQANGDQGTAAPGDATANMAAGVNDPFTVGLGVPGLADPWQAHHVAAAMNAAQARAVAEATAAAAGQTAPQVEEFQAQVGADQNDGMSQTPGLRPNTLFPDSAAPQTPQLPNQDPWSGYTPNPTSDSWVDIQAPTRHESGTNYLLSRHRNLASFVNQLRIDFGAPQGVAAAAWQQQQMGLAARDLGITATGLGSGSLQNSPGAAGLKNPAGRHFNLSQEEQAVLHSLLARAGIRLPGTANVAGMNAPPASPQAAGLLEPTPFTMSSGTTRASAEAAAQSITGKKAKIWMRTLAEQIQSRSALEVTPAGVAQAVHKMHGLDNRPCPPWDGNNPGDTFRQWIQEQTHWLILTNKKYEFWGIML